MHVLPGYHITETLHNSSQKIVYRGVRNHDRLPVVIKALKADYPTLDEITRIRHEYQIAKNLQIEGIVKTLGLEKHQNSYALILEDIGGKSLDRLLEVKRFQLAEALSLGVRLAQILAQLHQHNIIHKDIKPSNLIINSTTGQVKIADFSIATCLPKEIPQPGSASLLEGTLAYMSPEQTGRMNRSVDYRSDFYALGITLYEMLTGQLPFGATEPLELIHCHIAVTPTSPHQLNPEIPEIVSAIVMKLLAKNAEDRYQSASGLKTDLEICLEQWQERGKIDRFPLGQRDRSSKLLVPQKLYGREQEIAVLLEAFERVSSPSECDPKGTRFAALGDRRQAELILISGYSGVGKTSVINEIHKPIVRKRGYFIAGKYDQLQRDIPYSGLIQAFDALIQQLLTETADQIAQWRNQLLTYLGENGQAIVNAIPKIELIIGPQPPLLELGLKEAQYRFNRTFKEFVRAFAQPEHPLVLFLDDLQWADLASLELLESLASNSEGLSILFIGAYRDNEVSATHPLTNAIESIQETGAIVRQLALQPLDLDCTSRLIADTLHCDSHHCTTPDCQPERQKPLAELLFHQTGGNPFCLTQLLQTLWAERLLTFDLTSGSWQWEIEKIRAVGILDRNVVELVARNLHKLSPATQQVLQLAACIGSRFDLEILAIVNDKNQTKTAMDLWEALETGLIVPLNKTYTLTPGDEEADLSFAPQLSKTYKFVHDRVQQAAYSLIPDPEKKQIHLKIGQLLLQNTRAEAISKNIFAIVNQLNMSVELMVEMFERVYLAKLNLIAGKKAKVANAYRVALQYLNVGLALLPPSSWQDRYDLTYNLHLEALEAEYTSANFEQFNQLSDALLSRSHTILEKVKVYELKISFYFTQNKMQTALDTGLEVLNLLGVRLPPNPTKLNILLEFARTKLLQGRRRIEDLADLPEMTDPYKLSAIRVLRAIGPVSFVIKPELYSLKSLKMTELALKYGNSPLSCCGYLDMGLIYSAVLGSPDKGYQYCQLGLGLLEQFQAKEVKSFLSALTNTFVRHWKEPIWETLESLQEGVQVGHETGDIENACHCAAFYCSYLFLSGNGLEFVVSKQAQSIEMIEQNKQEFQLNQARVWHQVALKLQGESEELSQLVGKQFNVELLIPHLIEVRDNMGTFAAYVAQVLLSYLFKDYPRAIEQATLAEKYEQGGLGTAYIPVLKFYSSLALLSTYSTASQSQQQQSLKKIKANQQKMKCWASHCPANYQHKYELVEAEKARILGQDEQAAQYYDRAIAGARENGYIQEEALANELAAEFYFSLGREKLARMYLSDAYSGYLNWGAKAKVEDLRSRYPRWFSALSAIETPVSGVMTTHKTTSAGSREGSALLDLATVMKASQAISREIVLENLLHQLMQIVMENAGAQQGFLFLQQETSLILVAEAGVESQKQIELPFVPIAERSDLPTSVLNYIQRTQETVVLNNATTEGLFTNAPYIIEHCPQSLLGFPILYQGKLTGILYLENRVTTGAFTRDRLEVISLLSTQAAISLENSQLYASLEAKVAARTQELNEKNLRLKKTLKELEQAQLQLIQSEKMSSLGQLVAGVAHEINNPVSFIYGNLRHADEYTHDLLDLIQLYQKHCPNAAPEIQDKVEEMDLEFLVKDLPKMLGSMRVGATRIQKIVESLRNFSRLDESEIKSVDLHEGIENTLAILQNRLRGKANCPAIEVIKDYARLPEVECYASTLNQVLMNILNNAIDALEQLPAQHPSPQIQICTEATQNQWVIVRIADNGIGMSEEVKKRVFDPFFTTKPVGKGTGMGMAVSYQIVNQHNGKLECVSTPGKGTEFIIQIPTRQSDRQPIRLDEN